MSLGLLNPSPDQLKTCPVICSLSPSFWPPSRAPEPPDCCRLREPRARPIFGHFPVLFGPPSSVPWPPNFFLPCYRALNHPILVFNSVFFSVCMLLRSNKSLISSSKMSLPDSPAEIPADTSHTEKCIIARGQLSSYIHVHHAPYNETNKNEKKPAVLRQARL